MARLPSARDPHRKRNFSQQERWWNETYHTVEGWRYNGNVVIHFCWRKNLSRKCFTLNDEKVRSGGTRKPNRHLMMNTRKKKLIIFGAPWKGVETLWTRRSKWSFVSLFFFPFPKRSPFLFLQVSHPLCPDMWPLARGGNHLLYSTEEKGKWRPCDDWRSNRRLVSAPHHPYSTLPPSSVSKFSYFIR